MLFRSNDTATTEIYTLSLHELFRSRLGCECSEPGYCYTIEHGGYKPKDIDIEYCEMVTKKCADSALIKFKDIPALPKPKVKKKLLNLPKSVNLYP